MSATTLQLSDYKILDSLGQGGNAFVYRATNKESEFVLKQLKSDHSWSFKEKKQRFIDETQSVLKVQNHIRGVLPIIDCALPDARGNYWYTMPVATPILKKNPELSLDEKTQAVIELADTMVLLHARGIVHRDIKPRNLYFYEGHYCLGDFGLVDYPDKSNVTRSHETVGPKFSIAPEMKRDANNYVGKHSSLSSLDDDYLGSLEGWFEHLQTGKSAYVDAVSREQTEISLIADIRKYYQNEAEERR